MQMRKDLLADIGSHPATRHNAKISTQAPSAANALPIVYEDNSCAILVKPPGFDCQEDIGGVFLSAGGSANLERPRPGHRLDRPVGGLLAVGKTRRATASFHRVSAARSHDASSVRPSEISSIWSKVYLADLDLVRDGSPAAQPDPWASVLRMLRATAPSSPDGVSSSRMSGLPT